MKCNATRLGVRYDTYRDELHDEERRRRRVELLDQLHNVSILQTTKYGHFVLDRLFLTFDLARVNHLQRERQLPRPVHVSRRRCGPKLIC